MKKKILGALALLGVALLGLCPGSAEKPVRIFLATDTHHLSPSLTDYGDMFHNVVYVNDGKLTEHSGEFVDALLSRAQAAQADVVVVTGDLTFNGERDSLLDIAEKFKASWEAGVPVIVLPGNHDISSTLSRNYFGHQSRPVENISQADFEQICSGFGRDQAIAKDEASFSLIYPVGDSIWLVLLDANTDQAPTGTLPDATLDWLASWLRKAQDQEKTVLSFSHQNLLPVNALYADEFTISNCDEVLRLYAQYGVRYHFSGHSHIQHETQNETGLTEYVTGPLCVTPLHYAVITLEGQNVHYEAHTLDMYEQEAIDRFRAPMILSMNNLLSSYALTQEERDIMSDFAATLNQAYFAGDRAAIQAMKESEGWALWRAKALGSFWYTYMWSIFEQD